MNTAEYASEFQRCLIALDVPGIRKLWAHTNPALFQPMDDEQALFSLHMARTRANSIPLKMRAYSHRWLLDHGFPSHLPDDLKPRAERLYPKVVTAVGLSVNFRVEELKPAGKLIERAMANAVEQLYADGEERPEVVRREMTAAGRAERRRLFGREKDA